jgi:hypothetical protein
MDSPDAELAWFDVPLANCNIVWENVDMVPGGRILEGRVRDARTVAINEREALTCVRGSLYGRGGSMRAKNSFECTFNNVFEPLRFSSPTTE